MLATRMLLSAAKPKILITGCLGQVGSSLVRTLRTKYGSDNVIATDVVVPSKSFYDEGPFMYADVTNYDTLAKIAVDERVDWVVHNSSIQSIVGENDPSRILDVHVTGIRNILELSKNLDLRVLVPSSIACFSPESGNENVPDQAVMKPKTVYGVSKCFTENIGIYFGKKYGVDFRCLRYPGIVSTLEEGSSPALKLYKPTTDDYPMMSLHAYRNGNMDAYKCPLSPNQRLPFMKIDDCLQATELLLSCDKEKVQQEVYNISGASFSPAEFEAEVQKHLPDFKLNYELSGMDEVAESWPSSVNDSAFRNDFDWRPSFTLSSMVPALLTRLGLVQE